MKFFAAARCCAKAVNVAAAVNFRFGAIAAAGHLIHGRPPCSLPVVWSSRYPIIMPTNERMLYSQLQQEQCIHWLALLWDIWRTIWLED